MEREELIFSIFSKYEKVVRQIIADEIMIGQDNSDCDDMIRKVVMESIEDIKKLDKQYK